MVSRGLNPLGIRFKEVCANCYCAFREIVCAHCSLIPQSSVVFYNAFTQESNQAAIIREHSQLRKGTRSAPAGSRWKCSLFKDVRP